MVDVINPNITAGIGGSSDPMGTVYKFAAIQNMLNQNQLFQQTYRARQALGPIAQASVGPDGQMDWDKYATLVSTHPETAWMAPDILNNIAQRKLIDAETVNQKLNATEKRLDIFSNLAAGASKTLTGEPGHDIVSWYSDARAMGGIDPTQEKAWIGKLAELNALPVPEQKSRLAQMAMGTAQGRDALSKINGAFIPDGAVDNQGNKYPIWMSTVTGNISPAQLSGGGMTQSGAGAPLPGGLPASQGFPGPAAQPAATGVPQAPSQPNLTLRQPGEPLQAAYKYGQGLDDAADYSQRFLNTTKEGEQLLNGAMTGRAIPTRLEIGRWATSAGVDPQKVDQIVGGSANQTQALAKVMLYVGTQAMRQANEGNAAVRSVQEWQKFIEANPNLANDPGAIRQMWDLMKFQSRMTVAEQREYYNWRDSGKDLTKFRPAWNSYADQQMDQYLRATKDRDWNKPTEIGE